MSKDEIVAELSKLSPGERRQLARLIFEMEADAEGLRECERKADERFLMLDALEAEDAKTDSNKSNQCHCHVWNGSWGN